MSHYEYQGMVHATGGEMCRARRVHYVELLNQGVNFTKAARMVGVSKRTGESLAQRADQRRGQERTAPGRLVSS